MIDPSKLAVGARLLACSDKHPPKLAKFAKTARNGYTWISLPDGDETGLWLWPTDQLRKVG